MPNTNNKNIKKVNNLVNHLYRDDSLNNYHIVNSLKHYQYRIDNPFKYYRQSSIDLLNFNILKLIFEDLSPDEYYSYNKYFYKISKNICVNTF